MDQEQQSSMRPQSEQPLGSIMPSRLGRGGAANRLRFQPKLVPRNKGSQSVEESNSSAKSSAAGPESTSENNSLGFSNSKGDSGNSRNSAKHFSAKTGPEHGNFRGKKGKQIRSKPELVASGPFAFGPAASSRVNNAAGRMRDFQRDQVPDEPDKQISMLVDEPRSGHILHAQDHNDSALSYALQPISLDNELDELDTSKPGAFSAPHSRLGETNNAATTANSMTPEETEEVQRYTRDVSEVHTQIRHAAQDGFEKLPPGLIKPKLGGKTSTTDCRPTSVVSDPNEDSLCRPKVESQEMDIIGFVSETKGFEDSAGKRQIGNLDIHESGAVTMTLNGVPLQLFPGSKCRFGQQLVDMQLETKQFKPLAHIQQCIMAIPDLSRILGPTTADVGSQLDKQEQIADEK